MARQFNEFDTQAARHLFLIVIHQAITDVLENEGEAEAAKQWLSSIDFDCFIESFGCDTELFRRRFVRCGLAQATLQPGRSGEWAN